MKVYVDADILVSLLSPDANTSRASAALGRGMLQVLVSDFGGAEFASVISRKVRMREIGVAEARSILTDYDQWIDTFAQVATLQTSDVTLCTHYLRRLDLALKTPDAMHIAIASRLGGAILSFDRKLIRSAKKLGVAVA